MNKVLFSKNTDHWATPKNLYNALIDSGFIDVCPLYADYDTPFVHYDQKRLYINLPYSQTSKWVDYAIEESKSNIVYLLIPSRTDTIYFHKLLKCHPIIYFIKGRLHFNDLGCAPFPSLIVILSNCKRCPIYTSGTIENLIHYIEDFH